MNKSKIYTATTNDISVTVVSTYEPGHSKPDQNYFVFSYEVTIVNLSNQEVRLVSIEWFINDLLMGEHYVEGEGVIGQQPVILPGESFMYSSWSPLHSDLGFMAGNYTFEEIESGHEFKVTVPTFYLIPGFKKN